MIEPAPLLALLFAAAGLGYMLFFAGAVAPLVFTQLPEDLAGKFIRRLFPIYYGVGAVVFAAAGLSVIGHWTGWLLLAVAVAFVYARQILMPTINRLRDAQLAGDEEAGGRFERLHQASVYLNGGQVLAIVVALVALSL